MKDEHGVTPVVVEDDLQDTEVPPKWFALLCVVMLLTFAAIGCYMPQILEFIINLVK